MNKKRVGLVIMAFVLASTSLTGCGGNVVVKGDATKVPLAPELTKQEVLDYYAEALKYDTVVSRSATEDVNIYEVSSVKSEEKQKLIGDTTTKTMGYLADNNYKADEETERYLSDSLYNYIRAFLNDKKLSDPSVEKINQALGYYFIDVDFRVSPASIGKFTDTASLLGMNGAFRKNAVTDKDEIDKTYLMTAQKRMNDWAASNNHEEKFLYDEGANWFGLAENKPTAQNEFTDTTVTENIPIDGEVSVEETPAEETPAEETPVEETSTEETLAEDEAAEVVTEETVTVETEPVEETETEDSVFEERTTGVDLDVFNKVVGAGSRTSYVPDLSLIYTQPESADSSIINGIGIYPSGGLGLSLFGFNRAELEGKVTLRFIYKEDLENPNILTCENIYPTFCNISTGFNANNQNMIPEFLNDEFNVLIDRADRTMINNDTTGLVSGNVFSDIGMGVLNGYKAQSTNNLRQISTLRRIISRDIENNAYLVELESYVQEGAKSADVYATYKDQIYAVVQQRGSEFVITDWMLMNRQLYKEPDINPDAATDKRIVALGLTGEVSDEAKTSAQNLLDTLYEASTNRKLHDEAKEDGTVEKGMYECFNDNIEMLSSSRKEEINAHLRELLVKNGVNIQAQMNGIVTEWLGGSEKQVEFTTEEYVKYQGRDTGYYMTCYYLISCMEDKWVIDDRQVLSQEEVSGDGLTSVVNRIGAVE